ncbi:MAG: hypothetical protein ACKPKO_27940 [Candidatus Fonsibacter sp.]
MGGQIGDDGKESIRALNYNAICTYAVKAIQELSDIVKTTTNPNRCTQATA